MLKRILGVLALATGVITATTSTATAEPVYYPPAPLDSTHMFVSVFDPAAYSSRRDDWLIVSPYGTSQPIQCSWARGQSACGQIDPWGNMVSLNQYATEFGSSTTYMMRPVYVFAP